MADKVEREPAHEETSDASTDHHPAAIGVEIRWKRSLLKEETCRYEENQLPWASPASPACRKKNKVDEYLCRDGPYWGIESVRTSQAQTREKEQTQNEVVEVIRIENEKSTLLYKYESLKGSHGDESHEVERVEAGKTQYRKLTKIDLVLSYSIGIEPVENETRYAEKKVNGADTLAVEGLKKRK